MRIIGGRWRRRLLRFPDVPGLRPTADRVRETLFNWLAPEIEGTRCLDLYAGSGALGFEALSRGAAQATLVESDRRAFAALEQSAKALNVDGARLVPGDALEFLRGDAGRYDVIFVDPPFAEGKNAVPLDLLGERLAGGGLVYLESAAPWEPVPGWRLRREGRAGRVHFHLLERAQVGEH